MAPKKPNWDLKRDLEPKLEKLERKTAVAIAEMIRKRLKEQGDVSQVAAAAEASRAANRQEDDD